MILQNARLILTDRILPNGWVRIDEGKIADFGTGNAPATGGGETVDLGGRFLAPGFIDMHIHGALRRDTMEATREAFETICAYHAKGGTTALALTTVTATNEDILHVLKAVHEYRLSPSSAGAQILGAHIEGPYFSPEKRGAHHAHLLRHPKREEWSQWLEFADDITQMTLAVELPGALELIDALVAHDIRVSGGHSDAWDEDAAAAFAHGMRQATHTFNCMSTARRRGPYRVAGLVEFVMSEPEILCELIADGHHVSPTLMRMLYRAKGPDGIALITDALGGAGLAEGEHYDALGLDCIVRDGVGLLADGSVLAGSVTTMIRCVENMVKLVGLPLHEAVQMASLNPARALDLDQQKGTIAKDLDADLVAFDDEFQVSHTYVDGRRVV